MKYDQINNKKIKKKIAWNRVLLFVLYVPRSNLIKKNLVENQKCGELLAVFSVEFS